MPNAIEDYIISIWLVFIVNYETRRKTKKVLKNLALSPRGYCSCNSYILYCESILEDEIETYPQALHGIANKQLARMAGEVTVPSPLGRPPRSSV